MTDGPELLISWIKMIAEAFSPAATSLESRIREFVF
jgi:hypothetical protein